MIRESKHSASKPFRETPKAMVSIETATGQANPVPAGDSLPVDSSIPKLKGDKSEGVAKTARKQRNRKQQRNKESKQQEESHNIAAHSVPTKSDRSSTKKRRDRAKGKALRRIWKSVCKSVAARGASLAVCYGKLKITVKNSYLLSLVLIGAVGFGAWVACTRRSVESAPPNSQTTPSQTLLGTGANVVGEVKGGITIGPKQKTIVNSYVQRDDVGDFNFVICIDQNDGFLDMLRRQSVTIRIVGLQVPAAVVDAQGQACFVNIPASHRGKLVCLQLVSEVYEWAKPEQANVRLVPNNSINLSVQRKAVVFDLYVEEFGRPGSGIPSVEICITGPGITETNMKLEHTDGKGRCSIRLANDQSLPPLHAQLKSTDFHVLGSDCDAILIPGSHEARYLMTRSAQ